MVGTFTVAPAAGTVVEAEPEVGDKTALTVTSELHDANGDITTPPSWSDNGGRMLVVEHESESVAFVDTTVDRAQGLGFQQHTAVHDESAHYGSFISRGGWLAKVDLNDLSVDGHVKVGDSSRARPCPRMAGTSSPRPRSQQLRHRRHDDDGGRDGAADTSAPQRQ